MAARLKIPHEWLWRTAPSLDKKIMQRDVAKEGGQPGEPGDEVWVHVAPPQSEIDDFFARRSKRVSESQLQAEGGAEEGGADGTNATTNQKVTAGNG